MHYGHTGLSLGLRSDYSIRRPAGMFQKRHDAILLLVFQAASVHRLVHKVVRRKKQMSNEQYQVVPNGRLRK